MDHHPVASLNYGRGLHAGEVPRFVQYVSPVLNHQVPQNGLSRTTSLPLNLIAMIVSYLDDVDDIARVCRTCRLLYYMTLPQLYRRVALHSYPDIQYSNGRPEGFGSGSPFMLALNGLVTGNHAALVREFRVWGHWRELGVEDYTKGRVPDGTMMLNILLRTAVDRMSKLHSFNWDLDCNPLKTLYQGLAARDTLTHLTIRFPSTRIPRPSVLVPPIPNLRSFRAIDIDPLCHPDDFSMLILHSRKIEDCRLHFSPRMRQQAEPTDLGLFFNRCYTANYAPTFKHFAMQNFFGVMQNQVDKVFDPATCKSITFFDTFGGITGGSANVYVDDSWRNVPENLKLYFRTVRCNEMAVQHVGIISRATGMEKLYFVDDRRAKLTPKSPTSPMTPNQTPPSGRPDADIVALGREYLHAITRKHGSTMKHLLLSDQWALNQDEVGEVIRYCPNLEQLGMSLGDADHTTLRILCPFLPKLHSLRILESERLQSQIRELGGVEMMMELMSKDLWKPEAQQVKFIGMGDRILKTGGVYQIIGEDGRVEMRREITLGTLEDVKHIELWGLDCMDIMADPSPVG